MTEHNEDGLGPARGCVNGLLMAAVLWGWTIVSILLGWLLAKGF